MGTTCLANGQRQRQTATLTYEMLTVWETKPRKSPQKISGLLVGPEQGSRPKSLQALLMMMMTDDIHNLYHRVTPKSVLSSKRTSQKNTLTLVFRITNSTHTVMSPRWGSKPGRTD
jgi:hypothetical protein